VRYSIRGSRGRFKMEDSQKREEDCSERQRASWKISGEPWEINGRSRRRKENRKRFRGSARSQQKGIF
jgi:hypothetical protein